MPTSPRRLLAVAAVLLITTLLVAAAPASAGGRITTETGARTSPAWSDSFGPHHLPDPGFAQRLSARRTSVPFVAGTLAFAVDVAFIRSGYVALGGYAIAAYGIVAGPYAGYGYGGIPARGAVGVGLRLAVVVAAPVAVSLHEQAAGDWADEDDAATFGLALLAGTGLAALSGVWDIVNLPNNVERNNHRLLQDTSVRVVPAVTPFAHAPAIAIRVGFGSGGS